MEAYCLFLIEECSSEVIENLTLKTLRETEYYLPCLSKIYDACKAQYCSKDQESSKLSNLVIMIKLIVLREINCILLEKNKHEVFK